MKHLFFIRILAACLSTVMLLLSLSACKPDDPTPPPEESGETEKTKEAELFDFKGEPYYIKYEANGAITSGCVTDIIINPDYTEDFTLVIPATCQYGIVTKIDIEGFDHPDAVYNVPHMMTRADFEALRDRLAEKKQTEQDDADYQRFLSCYECHDVNNSVSYKHQQVILAEHPLTEYLHYGYYELRFIAAEEEAWLSEYLLTKAAFDAEDRAKAEYEVIKPRMEAKSSSYLGYAQSWKGLFYRGTEHMVGIVLPETVSEIVGDPFANCTNVKSITTQGAPDNFTQEYEGHEQLLAGHPMADLFIPFERINAKGEFNYQWFYHSNLKQRLSYSYGVTLANGAAMEVQFNHSYMVLSEMIHFDLPSDVTDMRQLDIRWYDALGNKDPENYVYWYRMRDIVVTFDQLDEGGWKNGLEYYYEYIDGVFKLKRIALLAGDDHQFIFTVNADTLPYGDGSLIARLLDPATARAARDEFIASLGLTEQE